MKKIIFFLMMILLLNLSACKVAPAEETISKPLDTPAQQWEYQWVTVRCTHDGGENQVVCMDLKTAEHTFLGNLLNGMVAQGFELDEVVHTSDPAGTIQTFIFRRPYTAVVAQE